MGQYLLLRNVVDSMVARIDIHAASRSDYLEYYLAWVERMSRTEAGLLVDVRGIVLWWFLRGLVLTQWV